MTLTILQCEENVMMSEKMRVYCLYRVSTDKQVDYGDNHAADIPMQRKACHRFAAEKDGRSSMRSRKKAFPAIR